MTAVVDQNTVTVRSHIERDVLIPLFAGSTAVLVPDGTMPPVNAVTYRTAALLSSLIEPLSSPVEFDSGGTRRRHPRHIMPGNRHRQLGLAAPTRCRPPPLLPCGGMVGSGQHGPARRARPGRDTQRTYRGTRRKGTSWVSSISSSNCSRIRARRSLAGLRWASRRRSASSS